MSAADDEDTSLPSHAPLPDAKPLLTLFTPFEVESSISPPSTSDTADDIISQKHLITMKSPGKLLACTLALTVETDPSDRQHPKLSAFKVQSLSPWVRKELGPWLNEREKEHDVSSIGYGLGRYWDICLRRARCWTQLTNQFPHLFPKAGPNNEKKSVISGGNTTELKRADLIQYLDRTALLLKSTHVFLRISWAIELDWTGEAESKVNAKAMFPRAWQEADSRKSFDKVPETFDLLVRKMGVSKAAVGIISILFKGAD
jgi:hypothetical protein